MGANYSVSSLVFSPEHLGVPNERLRIYTLALDNDRVVLTKPLSEFLPMFGCRRALGLNVYFCASEAAVLEEIASMAAKEAVECAQGHTVIWEDVLAAGKVVRLQAYREGTMQKFPESEDDDAVEIVSGSSSITMSSTNTSSASSTSGGPPFLFDLEQTVGGNPRQSSDVVPCLIRNNDFFNDSPTLKRGFTKQELLGVIGVPLLDEYGTSWKCPWSHLLSQGAPGYLSMGSCANLAGNGMHINAIGSLLMWLLAHLVPREVADPRRDRVLMRLDSDLSIAAMDVAEVALASTSETETGA